MPTYSYVCENYQCQHSFEIHQSFNETTLVKCPVCQQESLKQKYCVPFFFLRSEPTTLAHQAERNSERLGRREVVERTARSKEKLRQASTKMLESTKGRNLDTKTSEGLPWWRSGEVEGLPKYEKPLTPAQVQKVHDELKQIERETTPD